MIERYQRVEMPVEDVSRLEAGEREKRVQAEMQRAMSEPVDLQRGPVMKVKLLQLGEEEHVLLRVVHHIASDG